MASGSSSDGAAGLGRDPQMKQLQTLLEWSMQNTTPDSMREYAQQVERGDRPKPVSEHGVLGSVFVVWI